MINNYDFRIAAAGVAVAVEGVCHPRRHWPLRTGGADGTHPSAKATPQDGSRQWQKINGRWLKLRERDPGAVPSAEDGLDVGLEKSVEPELGLAASADPTVLLEFLGDESRRKDGTTVL